MLFSWTSGFKISEEVSILLFLKWPFGY